MAEKDNGYLKLLVVMLHNDHEIIDLQLGRPIQLRDFNLLSSEQMLKIVAYLLMDIVGKKSISKVVALEEFNNFDGANISYDNGPDQIYRVLKQLLPEDFELFHYSMLLFPSKEPRKTKQFLSYIVEFVMMCDELLERFSHCYNGILQESEERCVIHNDIQDLKEKILIAIEQNQRLNERIPILLKLQSQLDEIVRRDQLAFAKLNKVMEEKKTAYEAKTGEIKRLEMELQRLEDEKKNLSGQIVNNSIEITEENNRLKKELMTLTEQRKTFGLDLEQLRKESGIFESLIARVKETIKKFENLIEATKVVRTGKESSAKSNNELTALIHKINKLKTEAVQLSLNHTAKTKETNGLVKSQESKRKQTVAEIARFKIQIRDIGLQIETASSHTIQMQESFKKMEEEVHILQNKTARYYRDVMVVIPQKKKEMDEEQKEYLEKMFKKFSTCPTQEDPDSGSKS